MNKISLNSIIEILQNNTIEPASTSFMINGNLCIIHPEWNHISITVSLVNGNIHHIQISSIEEFKTWVKETFRPCTSKQLNSRSLTIDESKLLYKRVTNNIDNIICRKDII